MATHMQRLLAPARALEPGQYTVETMSGRAAICCKRCGTITELAEHHTVKRGGMVTGCWTCPQPTCGFSDFLLLDDADEPAVPR